MNAGRKKVIFPSVESLRAGTALESHHTTSQLLMLSERRRFLVLEPTPATTGSDIWPDLIRRDAEFYEKEFHAETYDDYQYELDTDSVIVDADVEDASLTDVLDRIRATVAWEMGFTGRGTAIAVVDTGINAVRPEFPSDKRIGGWAVPGNDPWTDYRGHGSMCACIAAGTTCDGGDFNGIAPNASLISCRTHFYDSELTLIFDFLSDLRTEKDMPVVATNSYGRMIGTAPSPPGPGDTFPEALDNAIDNGVHVFFSAGNNHHRTEGDSADCAPNSIWLHKSRADVMCVATCDLDGNMWHYSSRGPGQHFGKPNTNLKPDVTAPTPRNGRVPYGCHTRVLANGWGTSGACPQVAGLAALLLEMNPQLSRADLFDAICKGSVSIGDDRRCGGYGLINCEASLNIVSQTTGIG